MIGEKCPELVGTVCERKKHVGYEPGLLLYCENSLADIDNDGDVDGNDFLSFSVCYNGALNPPQCP